MAEKTLRYSTVLFDWGDTVMRDDPDSTTPMVEWSAVAVIDGVAEVLAYLHATGRKIVLATSASISDEDQIRGALRRGGLSEYFSHIYCFKNTNLPKGEEFYRYILRVLGIAAADALMVGDGFEKDVRIPNRLGIFAVWFHHGSAESRQGDLCITVHFMVDLLAFFQALDQN